jgi:protein associated with RNAse G/E
MAPNVKIRGIYTTALTKFFIDSGITIVSPSQAIAARFKDSVDMATQKTSDVDIGDLEDSQGIMIRGESDHVDIIAGLFRENFTDAIFRMETHAEMDCITVEFPYLAKSRMDEFRNSVVPTVFNHHRLRLINSRYVDLMETKELANHPEKRETVSKSLEKRLIWNTYKKSKEIAIDHVKLNGQVIALSEGEIIECDHKAKRLILKRKKFTGGHRYDGLNLPKQEGDYAVTEVTEGNFFYRHSYFRHDGRLIGEYYNINTPVEFYPDKIRYVDLEIDVVRWLDGKIEIIDEEDLNRYAASCHLTNELLEKAIETARNILR